MAMPLRKECLTSICLCVMSIGQSSWSQAPTPEANSKDVSITINKISVHQKFSTRYGYHLEPILNQIQATPAQRKKITDIVMSYKPKLEPLRQKYRQESNEFLTWITSGVPAEKVMARQGELNNLYGIIVTQYSIMRLEIRRNLTPEQCKLFEEYRQKQGWASNKQ